MEPRFRHDDENSSSQPTRSRSGTATSNSQFCLQQYLDSPRGQPLPSPALSSRDGSAAYLSPLPQDPSNYLPTPVSRTYSPFPAVSPELLDAEWSAQQEATAAAAAAAATAAAATPSIKIEEQGTGYSSLPQPAALQDSAVTAAMSAVAIPYDPTFAMGNRSAFTWPGISGASSEAGGHLLGHDLSSLGTGSDASLTPPSVSRSVTASPPRASMTPEHREIKRQMEQVRRDSKTHARIRRSNSNSYAPDTSSSLHMPVYTTSPAPISLLAEPATTMAAQPYLPSYSPPLHDQAQTTVSNMPSLYQTSYQQPPPLQPSYNMGLDYPSAFQTSSSYGRSRHGPMSVGSEPSMMYHMPAIMTTGGPGAGPDAGHVRVVQSRPKPQCWEHGCNGRQFSTFSNLLRHQREKSGQASKASCPKCGAEFTRTTARNGHLLHDKCKQTRSGSHSGSNNGNNSS